MPDYPYYHYQKPLLSFLKVIFRVIWSGIATVVLVDNLSTKLGNNSSAQTPSDTSAKSTTNSNKECPL
jgi:hypothetical protein